ncbi:hypothetical protein [Achromobacter piechaudii]|uniref:hypothetical protein n=1 Tax=Achromobacter piechaudii TaxID=72556 RepID=UPI00158179CA|nr:hypothetical protein [Achromobacter piechaudii]
MFTAPSLSMKGAIVGFLHRGTEHRPFVLLNKIVFTERENSTLVFASAAASVAFVAFAAFVVFAAFAAFAAFVASVADVAFVAFVADVFGLFVFRTFVMGLQCSLGNGGRLSSGPRSGRCIYLHYDTRRMAIRTPQPKHGSIAPLPELLGQKKPG